MSAHRLPLTVVVAVLFAAALLSALLSPPHAGTSGSGVSRIEAQLAEPAAERPARPRYDNRGKWTGY